MWELGILVICEAIAGAVLSKSSGSKETSDGISICMAVLIFLTIIAYGWHQL
jgi:hypothetical protein